VPNIRVRGFGCITEVLGFLPGVRNPHGSSLRNFAFNIPSFSFFSSAPPSDLLTLPFFRSILYSCTVFSLCFLTQLKVHHKPHWFCRVLILGHFLDTAQWIIGSNDNPVQFIFYIFSQNRGYSKINEKSCYVSNRRQICQEKGNRESIDKEIMKNGKKKKKVLLRHFSNVAISQIQTIPMPFLSML